MANDKTYFSDTKVFEFFNGNVVVGYFQIRDKSFTDQAQYTAFESKLMQAYNDGKLVLKERDKFITSAGDPLAGL